MAERNCFYLAMVARDRVSLTKIAKCKSAVKRLHPIHNFSEVNATWGFAKVVFPIEVDVLPTHWTHAFDLIGLLLITLKFFALQQL